MLETPDGDEDVGSGKRARDFGQRHFERLQFVWIDSDPIFFDATALDADTGDSLNGGKCWAQSVKREIAQLDERMRIGRQAVGDHRKHGRIHALDFE